MAKIAVSIRVDEDVLEGIKQAADADDRSVGYMFEQAARAYLAGLPPPPKKARVKPSGLPAGVRGMGTKR